MAESESMFFMAIGIPGSGKSTALTTFPAGSIVSPDRIRKMINGDINDQRNGKRVWEIVFKRIVKLLRTQGLAVLDATNVESNKREELLNRIKSMVDTPIKTVAMVFRVDPEVAKQRIAKDIESGKDRTNVPDYAIDRMYDQFQSGYSDIQHQFDRVING